MRSDFSHNCGVRSSEPGKNYLTHRENQVEITSGSGQLPRGISGSATIGSHGRTLVTWRHRWHASFDCSRPLRVSTSSRRFSALYRGTHGPADLGQTLRPRFRRLPYPAYRGIYGPADDISSGPRSFGGSTRSIARRARVSAIVARGTSCPDGSSLCGGGVGDSFDRARYAHRTAQCRTKAITDDGDRLIDPHRGTHPATRGAGN